MKNNFIKFIKAVGTGPKHNHDLSQEEMNDAMSMMLNGEVYPEQISAFLLGWRLKPETTEEFSGTIDAFDKYVIRKEINNSVELGYPYDGKRNNPYLFPLIAKVLEQHKLNVVITGDELQPAKDGVTVKEISNSIDLPSNLYYFDRTKIFKEMSDLTEVRNRLGIRTGLNSIERLINPGLSKYAFIGVFHKPFMEKYVKMFAHRYEKLVIVKGNEGTSEIFSKCQYWIAQNGNITEHKIDPIDFGINYTKSWDRISIEESLENLNNPSDELLNIAKLNAALILFISNKVKSVEDGYDLLSPK
ncbi:MAG: glycosyl transferase [Campylobacterota bacterium]|nr:glycosyl transferase [Campylobacterota bacterium]